MITIRIIATVGVLTIMDHCQNVLCFTFTELTYKKFTKTFFKVYENMCDVSPCNVRFRVSYVKIKSYLTSQTTLTMIYSFSQSDSCQSSLSVPLLYQCLRDMGSLPKTVENSLMNFNECTVHSWRALSNSSLTFIGEFSTVLGRPLISRIHWYRKETDRGLRRHG